MGRELPGDAWNTRREFETWILGHSLAGAPKSTALSTDLERKGDDYARLHIQTLWECWQAGHEAGIEAML